MNTITKTYRRLLEDGSIRLETCVMTADSERVFYAELSGIVQLDAITDLMDPWLRCLVFELIAVGGKWRIEGRVSKSCLRNTQRLMEYWNSIEPTKCKVAEIMPDEVVDDNSVAINDLAILPFSGGLDASFTAYRYSHQLAGHKNLNIETAMMVHGADIPLADEDFFDRSLEINREMLADLGVFNMVVIKTNYREQCNSLFTWGYYTHMCVIVGLASFLSNWCSNIVMGSAYPYAETNLHWGCNPISDYMLSSRSFVLHEDDFALSRTQKAELVSRWSFGMERLRVCCDAVFDKSDKLNCGYCEKCTRTIMNFQACGVQLPNMRKLSPVDVLFAHGIRGLCSEYKTIVEFVERRGPTPAWIKVLKLKIGIAKLLYACPFLLKKVINKCLYIYAIIVYKTEWQRGKFLKDRYIPY